MIITEVSFSCSCQKSILRPSNNFLRLCCLWYNGNSNLSRTVAPQARREIWESCSTLPEKCYWGASIRTPACPVYLLPSNTHIYMSEFIFGFPCWAGPCDSKHSGKAVWPDLQTVSHMSLWQWPFRARLDPEPIPTCAPFLINTTDLITSLAVEKVGLWDDWVTRQHGAPSQHIVLYRMPACSTRTDPNT